MRAMTVVAAVLSVLIAVAAIGSAVAKLTKQPKIVENLTKLDVPMSWLPRLAVLEILGGAGVLIGFAVKPLGILAALGLFGYFVGAVQTHLKANDKQIQPPAALAVIALLAAITRALA
jgi:uncharacterized membrane protein YphA (DoxX/SURF4 family)